MKDATLVACPGCGLMLSDRQCEPAKQFNASGECLEKFHDLTCWTLAHRDGRFIHQHAVDAYESQHAGGRTRPITVFFGLVGLYLALEKGYTGRQVQLAHIKLGRTRRDWPLLEHPGQQADLTVIDVLRAETDREKEEMLMRWAASVWKIWEPRHSLVREIADTLLFSRH